MSTKKAKFHVNENVWACDKSVFYAAKILRHESLGPVNKYFVHYLKWDRKHDGWVDEKLIEPWNNGLPPISTSSQENAKKTNKKSGSSVVEEKVKEEEVKITEKIMEGIVKEKEDETPLESPISSRRGRKRKEVDSSFELPNESDLVPLPTTSHSSKGTYAKIQRPMTQTDLIQDPEEHTYHIKFVIPNDLKRHMVDEWMIITQETPGRLLNLPKPSDKNVKAILQHYLDERKSKFDDAQMRNAKELVSALLPLFDRALSSLLLYRQERAQYDALAEKFPKKKPSEIYGGEHFIRLFVRLPRLLSSIFGPQVQIVHANLVDLLKFIGKSSSQYINIHNYASDEDAMNIKDVKDSTNIPTVDSANVVSASSPGKRGRPSTKPRK